MMKILRFFAFLFVFGAVVYHVAPIYCADGSQTVDPIKSEPVDLFLVLDNSVDMKQLDPASKLSMFVTEFVKKMPASSHLGIILFDLDVKLVMGLTSVGSSDFQRGIDAGLKALNYRGKGRCGPAALDRAVRELTQRSGESSKRAIVFISCGEVQTGDSKRDREQANWLLDAFPSDAFFNKVRVFSVAFGSNVDQSLLQTLSNKVSGDYYAAQVVDDFQSILKDIQRDLTAIESPTSPSIAVEPTPSPAAPFHGLIMKNKQAVILSAYGLVGIFIIIILSVIIRRLRFKRVQAELAQRRKQEEARRKHSNSTNPSMRRPSPSAIADFPSRSGKSFTVAPKPVQEKILGNEITFEEENPPVKPLQIAPQESVIAAPASDQKDESKSHVIPSAKLVDINCVTGKPLFVLTRPMITIGRDRKLNDIVIPKTTISKQHARIEFRDQMFYLVDIRSTNGTFINGVKISDVNKIAEQPLKHGDRVSFDTFAFQFLLKESQEENRTIIRTFEGEMALQGAKGDPFSKTIILPSEEIAALTKKLENAPLLEDDDSKYYDVAPEAVSRSGIAQPVTEEDVVEGEDPGNTLERIAIRCYNHPEERASNTCISCLHSFCKNCLIMKDEVFLCKECAPYYMPDGG